MFQTRRILLIAAIVVAGGIIAWGYRVAHFSLEAERTHQAYLLVLDHLIRYLRDHPGGWPEAWKDLQDPSSKDEAFRSPESIAEIQRRVKVDFELTRDEVAKMNRVDFSAVEPIGPNYGRDESRIDSLLAVARNSDALEQPPCSP